MVGLVGYVCYTGRWAFQLWASKKAQQPVVPLPFWVLSLLGSIVIAVYAWGLGSYVIPVALPVVTGIRVYNIYLIKKKKKSKEEWLE